MWGETGGGGGRFFFWGGGGVNRTSDLGERAVLFVALPVERLDE